ncbi:MAG: hypothetical protein FJW37_02950, partial [Acidobacteria bacterium]|nr:hypothetical protein [Acidobacteriota bacterium]
TNLAATAEGQGEYHQSTLGPYDYWAIEYAYKPIEASTPEGELAELKKIASRAAEPLLAYATDEDAGISMNPFDMDPTANRWDLGSDPLKHYAHRVKLGREIFANMEARLEKPGEGYQVLTRSFLNTLFQTGLQMRQASKFIGGIYHHRDHIGDPGGRLPFQPAPAARQREALALLRENLFSPRAFQFSPRLLNKLNNTRFSDFRNFEAMLTRFDVPVHSLILGLQKNVLDRLHHPIVLSRVLDSEITSPAQPFRLSELFTTLQDSIWAEAREPGEALAIPSFRRALQREHLRKLIGLVLRDSAAPEDARTLARHQLSALRRQVNGALAKTPLKMPLEARAHLEESLARIDEALKANMQRMAF